MTSGLQSELFLPVAETPGFVFQRYEHMKRSYRNTAQSCEAQGFGFTPMVFEVHGGGWNPLAKATLDWISKQQAACHNDDPAAVSLKIAQRISSTLHRENVRAILQRTVAASSSLHPPSGWDEAPMP